MPTKAAFPTPHFSPRPPSTIFSIPHTSPSILELASSILSSEALAYSFEIQPTPSTHCIEKSFLTLDQPSYPLTSLSFSLSP